MNNRTVTAGVLAAVLIVAAWWVFVFSPARSDASKVGSEVTTAKAKSRITRDAEQKQLEDLEKRAPQIQADRDRLRNAVPDQPELATFIEQANQLGDRHRRDVGVGLADANPLRRTAAGTINARTAGEAAATTRCSTTSTAREHSAPRRRRPGLAGRGRCDGRRWCRVGGPPQLTASLTARMFDTGATAVAPDGSTTPTSVAGGGGVAAPQGQGS